MGAQVRNILAVEAFGTVNIEKVHNRVDAGVVFETQHVTQFVYSGAVHFIATHCCRRSRTHGDLPVKVGPPGELGPCDHTAIQNVGAAIDDPYGASAEVAFFMKVRDEYGIPKTERLPKCIRPRLVGIDLDADISENRPSHVIVLGARFIGAGPVRLRLFLCASRNLRSEAEPYCEDASDKCFALAQTTPPRLQPA